MTQPGLEDTIREAMLRAYADTGAPGETWVPKVTEAVREYLISDEAVERGAWALAKFGDIGEPSDWDRDAVEQVARALGGDDT